MLCIKVGSEKELRQALEVVFALDPDIEFHQKIDGSGGEGRSVDRILKTYNNYYNYVVLNRDRTRLCMMGVLGTSQPWVDFSLLTIDRLMQELTRPVSVVELKATLGEDGYNIKVDFDDETVVVGCEEFEFDGVDEFIREYQAVRAERDKKRV